MDFLYESLKLHILRTYDHWSGSNAYRDIWKNIHLMLHEANYPFWEDRLKEDITNQRREYLGFLQNELDKEIMY